MSLAIRSILAAVLAFGPLGAGAIAQSRDGKAGREPLHATMDRVFGPGGWRLTSGYRTPAQEDALRRRGAGTVPAGRRSSHSIGGPASPAAYDAVVPGMSQRAAAARLRRAGERFPRVLAEAAHGPQGPHLHIELRPDAGATARAPSVCDNYHGETITLRVVNGRVNPLTACENAWADAAASAAHPGK